MAYEKGDLKFGEKIIDSRTDGYEHVDGFYLPHSCEEWFIGGEDEVRVLVEDLQEALQNKKNQ